jgi:MFS family permease
MALLSMLPLLAQDRGAGPVELGLLFAAQGLGAISGALLLPSVETRLGPNATIGTAFVGAAFVLASVSVTSSLIVTGLLMAAAGWFWATALTTMTAALQIYLPAWVRARGLAVVAVAGFGGQALGALLSGWAAIHVSLVLILWIGAASLACGALLALWWPLRDLGELDRTPSTGWVDPELAVDVGQAPGVVVVSIVYWVDTAAESAFIERILDLRRVRLRNGATRWRLLKDAEGDNRFVEEYTVGSWEEYGQQQTHRLVISDRAVETAVHALSSTRTPAHHYFRIAP